MFKRVSAARVWGKRYASHLSEDPPVRLVNGLTIKVAMFFLGFAGLYQWNKKNGLLNWHQQTNSKESLYEQFQDYRKHVIDRKTFHELMSLAPKPRDRYHYGVRVDGVPGETLPFEASGTFREIQDFERLSPRRKPYNPYE